MAQQSTKQNSEFLLGLLLDENKHTNTMDFIDKSDKSANYACVCVSLALAQAHQDIKSNFTNSEEFFGKYFEIYASALENYRSIVGNDFRQIFIDEAKIFYPIDLATTSTKNLVSNATNKAQALAILDSIKDTNSYVIILRDDIAFIVISYEADYIIIDPHVEYCGILSKNSVYRYATYDSIWDFDVHFLTPVVQVPVEPNNEPSNDNLTVVQVPVENGPGLVTPEIFETSITETLKTIQDDVEKIITNSFSTDDIN